MLMSGIGGDLVSLTSSRTREQMHRPTPSSSYGNGHGLFNRGNVFNANNTNQNQNQSQNQTTTGRPSTSGGSTQETSSVESVPSGFSRKASVASISKKKSFLGLGRNNSISVNRTYFPEKRRPSVQHSTDEYQLPPLQQSTDFQTRAGGGSFPPGAATAETGLSPKSHSRTDSQSSTIVYANMLVRPATSYSNVGGAGGGLAFQAVQPPSPTLETITFQHIQETSSKRISTLDYLRKAHEGRVYWFNTLLFNKPDLQRMPYFESRKLARRATNYLLLGLSLPTVIDLNSSTPTEFLKTLSALLIEFESFQSIHPPDGSSSLSRARFPQMFKRATTGGGKGRRSSSATEIGLPMGNDSLDSKTASGTGQGGSANASTGFSMGETDLLPGEEYTHLLTPSLPFDPDFYETFATLCDVLIDCYTRLMSLVSGPRECSPYVAEMFTKVDARVRKIIVQGVVKEFEDSSRAGVKGEVAGVGRVVLGGLM